MIMPTRTICAAYEMAVSFGAFVEAHNGALNAIFAGVVALFTFTLWQSTERMWQASKEQIGVAKEAADATRIQAEALMDAEGAHLFPIIKSDNLKEVFRRVTSGATEPLGTPSIEYRFKNYGKTPAILYSVMHAIDFFETPSKFRTMHVADEMPLEIIPSGQESVTEFTVNLHRVLTPKMGNAIIEYRSELLFFGQASFKDFFDRKFRCIWEFDGRTQGFKWIKHEERADPD